MYDLIGMKFGKLTVISRAETPPESIEKRRLVWWNCLCECGGKKVVRSVSLRRLDTKSCGCGYQKHDGKSLIGQRFGKLVVLDFAGREPRGTDVLWRCKCDCGNETTPRHQNIIRGRTASCGCGMHPKKEVNATIP